MVEKHNLYHVKDMKYGIILRKQGYGMFNFL